MKCLLIFLLLVNLTACATVQDTLGDTRTLAACKAADIVTTVTALNTGSFHETNAIMKTLMTGAHGYFPFIAVSAAYVLFFVWLDNPKATAAASVITCGVAGHNAWLLAK